LKGGGGPGGGQRKKPEQKGKQKQKKANGELKIRDKNSVQACGPEGIHF